MDVLKISKRNLAIEIAAGPDSGRPVLESILFEREGSVSADGIRLAHVPYPEPCAEDDPAIGTPVPIGLARRAAKIARWRDDVRLERDGDRFAIVVRSRQLEDGKPDGTTEVRISGEVGTGPFPKWRNLVPGEKEVLGVVVVSTRYLIEAAEALHRAHCSGVRLTVAPGPKPLMIEGVMHEGAGEPLLLVMPLDVRSTRAPRPVPATPTVEAGIADGMD